MLQNKLNILIGEPTSILGLYLIGRVHRTDNRGFFERLFCAETMKSLGWEGNVAQINHSFTSNLGTVRGLHYQSHPFAESKLVSCFRGSVWDVVVDLRGDSPSFMQHVAVELSAQNQFSLLIPPGCAHGFQTMSNDVDMLYCHSMPYSPEHDLGVNACDPRFQIGWPLEVMHRSTRDSEFPFVIENFKGV